MAEPDYTLEDMIDTVPEDKKAGVINRLKLVQDSIKELDCQDVFQWLNGMSEGALITSKSKKEDVINRCSEIYSKWHKKHPTGENTKQIAINTKLASTFKAFMNDDAIPDPVKTYHQYLKYREVETILNNMLPELRKKNQSELEISKFKEHVDNICKITANRENAKSILINYCNEHTICIQQLKCPFCSILLETSDDYKSCPQCKESFIVKCPRCNKKNNLLYDSCHPIIRKYPDYKQKIKKAKDYIEKMEFDDADKLLNDVNANWKNFDGVDALKKECENARKKYKNEVAREVDYIKTLIKEKKYNTASVYISKLESRYKKYISDRFPEVQEIIVRVEQDLRRYHSSGSNEEKIGILLQLSEIIADNDYVNSELEKYPVHNVTDVRTDIDINSGKVILSWKSENEHNSVSYVIVKKIGSKVINISDGTIVARTKDKSYQDLLNLLDVAYYGVYAIRRDKKSNIAVTEEPVVYMGKINAVVSGCDGGFDAAWQPDSSEIVAYYSENRISSYEQGTRIKGITSTGFHVNGLENCSTYYVAIYRVMQVAGKKYRSALNTTTVMPMEHVECPEISVRMGANSGQYRLVHMNPQDNFELKFYYSNSPDMLDVSSGKSIEISMITSKLSSLNCQQESLNEYSFSMQSHDRNVYIYPVVVCRGIAAVGKQIELQYIEPISVTKGIVSGNDYAMYIDKWPERAENIYVCYKYDSYPRDYNDCDGCSIVTRNKFNSSNCLWIQQIHSEKYYVTFFREMLGKFMPIGNYTFDCGRRYEITCQFEKIGIFGKNVAIRFKSKDTDYIPELKFAVANGRVPLSINSASEVITIPEQQNFKGESVVKVEGFTLKKNYYGKLFCDNRKFTLIVSGDSKMA